MYLEYVVLDSERLLCHSKWKSEYAEVDPQQDQDLFSKAVVDHSTLSRARYTSHCSFVHVQRAVRILAVPEYPLSTMA